MADYTLYYWPIAFRGQLVRATLAHIGADWVEAGFDATRALKTTPIDKQLVPHMGPPVLTDHATGTSLSQMPAILAYLGAKHGLVPDDPARAALTHKIIADANDVLYEMTRHNGAQMWTPDGWAEFRPRLAQWMDIFEQSGLRHGLTPQTGLILGGDHPGLADIVTATLWGTMTRKLPALRPLLDDQAPAIAGLSDRIATLPAQAKLIRDSDAAWGDAWCSGQIEASLRAVL